MTQYAFVNTNGYVSSVVQSSQEPWTPEGYTLHILTTDLPNQPADYYQFNWDKQIWEDTRTTETQWPIVILQRNSLLQASDYTQLPDVPLDNKQAWATYRQELRDITNQPDPFNIIWPVQP